MADKGFEVDKEGRFYLRDEKVLYSRIGEFLDGRKLAMETAVILDDHVSLFQRNPDRPFAATAEDARAVELYRQAMLEGKLTEENHWCARALGRLAEMINLAAQEAGGKMPAPRGRDPVKAASAAQAAPAAIKPAPAQRPAPQEANPATNGAANGTAPAPVQQTSAPQTPAQPKAPPQAAGGQPMVFQAAKKA